MKYELFIQRRAQKQLASVPQPQRDRIIRTVRHLADTPRPTGVKKLTGREAWRIREGDYRIIFEIDDQALIVLIISIGHRRDVYRT